VCGLHSMQFLPNYFGLLSLLFSLLRNIYSAQIQASWMCDLLPERLGTGDGFDNFPWSCKLGGGANTCSLPIDS